MRRREIEMKKKSGSKKDESPAQLIDARIEALDDWRGEMLSRLRALIRQADPDVIEDVKWRKPSNSMLGVPVWSHDGIICTGETYKDKVKLTFARGAALQDPSGLFNASLNGNARRAIDVHESEAIDEKAFRALIRAAVSLNASSAKPHKAAPKSPSRKIAKPRLLSGGNPQIAKADGDAPVRAYIEALPGWKRDVGRRLDALIVRTVPNVRKAVRWNSPFYGIEGRGWFLGLHCLAKYIKLAFFRGTSLRPLPPVESKQEDVRYIHIHEDDQLDEEQLASWIRQASELPGWDGFRN
jgi:hypothetical protein